MSTERPALDRERVGCVDLLSADGHTIIDEKPISEATACRLLGVTRLDDLRAAADARVAAEVAAHATPSTDPLPHAGSASYEPPAIQSIREIPATPGETGANHAC